MRYILLKNQLKFSITTVVCVFLLSACGSNSIPTIAPDRAAFNAAVVAFDITTDAATLTTAELAFANFIRDFPASSLVDDAYYYIARSKHERAKLAQSALDLITATTLFTDARNIYSDGLKIPPTSNKADNAQLQIGKTYYDQATPTDNYAQALIEFGKVLANFSTSSVADDAQYYIGRTKHEQALLAQIALDTPAATALFNDARFEYNKLLITYVLSTRRDDAQYQIGRTYYDLTLPDYTQAITEFNRVFDTTLFTAPSAGDDARYYIGRSKHELALLPVAAPDYTLTQARAEYSLVITGYPLSSNRRDDAQYQIGRAHFDEGLNFATALAAFEAVFVATNFPVLSVADDARYYIGRSKHELALLPVVPPAFTLADARIEYLQVTSANFPGSNRLDDAQFQIGKTYFDEPTLANHYTLALDEFNKVLNPALFTAPSAGDNAQYYIGRTKHEQALLAQIAVNPVTPAATLFNEARSAYNVLLTPTYALSSLRDDAQYRIGRTHFDAGTFTTALFEFTLLLTTTYPSLSVADDAQFYKARSIHELTNKGTAGYTFAMARTEYNNVSAVVIPRLNSRLDDAAYWSALTYHDSTQCSLELSSMQAFVTAYETSVVPSTVVFVANARVEIADMNLATPSNTNKHRICI